MQILYTAPPEVLESPSEENELGAALHQIEDNLDERGRPVAHLATACAAALRSLDVMAADDSIPLAARLTQAIHTDEGIQPCYERIGRWLLSTPIPSEALTGELMRSSAQLFRDLAAVYAEENSEAGTPTLGSRDPALLVLRALWCLGMHAKWTYFMHQEADGSLWRVYHALYERAESLGAARRAIAPYSDPDVGKLSCADVYVQSLLLGMLNGGNLSAQQLELAHRWVVAFVRDAGIAPSDNGAAPHVFYVCLDSDRGLQSGAPVEFPTDVRFVDIAPVCARLLDSRESLRQGRIDLTDTGLQVAVLDYGAFLDLAERFWSPTENQVQERAPRVGTDAEPVEAVMGFDRVYQTAGGTLPKTVSPSTGDDAASNITFLYPEVEQSVAPFACVLKDKSASGVGLLVSGASVMPAPGALVGFRLSKSGNWETGMLVRRLAIPDSNQTLLGIKKITERPVTVTLRRQNPDIPARQNESTEVPAIYAPMDGERSRADSLVMRDAAFSRNADFIVMTGRATFVVRLTRVLDRGAGWVRAGFRVLSKG